MQRGVAALRRGDPTAAVELLQQAVEARPDDVEARFYLGLAYLRSGRPADAVEPLRRAEEMAPEFDPAIAVQLGTALMRIGEYRAARSRFRVVVDRDPDAPLPRLNLGWVLMQLDRGRTALELFQEVAERHPDHPLAHYYIGLVHQGNGEFDAAGDAYRRAVEVDPDFARALLALGRLALSRGRYQESRRFLERAADADPRLAEVPFHLGLLALRSGELDEAVVHLERALSLDPDHQGAQYNLGLAYARRGDEVPGSDALAAFAALQAEERRRNRRSLQESTRTPADDARERGVQALRRGDLGEATDAFRRAVELAGEEATAGMYLGLGSALLFANRTEAARRALEKAVRRDDELAEAFRLLADAYAELGLTERAERARSRYRQLVADRREKRRP